MFNMKWHELLIFIIASFALGMATLTLTAASRSKEPVEVVCDHPEWKDDGFAVVAATCTLNGREIKVVVLD